MEAKSPGDFWSTPLQSFGLRLFFFFFSELSAPFNWLLDSGNLKKLISMHRKLLSLSTSKNRTQRSLENAIKILSLKFGGNFTANGNFRAM